MDDMSRMARNDVVLNGHFVWKDLKEDRYIWHENGFWLMGEILDNGIQGRRNVDYKSEAYASCPELVENWTSVSNGGLSTNYIEKITSYDVYLQRFC